MKRPHFHKPNRRQIIIGASGLMLAIIATSVLVYGHHRQVVQQNLAQQQAQAQATAKQEIARQQQEAELQKAEQQKAQQATAQNTPVATKPSSTPIKDGKTSPRPTTTSKPGDLIGNNTTKAAKTYYGGPLIFSQSSVIYNPPGGSTGRPKVTVSSSDGTPISMPTSYWDSTQKSVWAGVDASLGLDTSVFRASWPMVIGTNTSIPGTYTLELVARALNNNDTVEYSGKITVIIL